MHSSPPIDSDQYLHFGFTCQCVEAGSRRTFHRHDEVEIALLETGSIDLLLGSQPVRLQAGRLAVYWGAIPHAPVKVAPGTLFHWMTLPLAWVLEWKLPRNCAQTIMGGKVFMERDDRHGVSDLALFARWHDDLKDGSAERRKVVLLEGEARLRRLLLDAPTPANRPARAQAGDRHPSKVELMSRFVALHSAEPLRIADVARNSGLHPDYAATLFRKTCGIGLGDYMTEHRVSHAQRLLATSDAKILEISLAVGFGSVSRFYSAFKKVCALTPRQYRREMGLG
jgi:AraC-like DNA-binding protein